MNVGSLVASRRIFTLLEQLSSDAGSFDCLIG